MKRHVINFVNNNILVTKMLNSELFRIIINYFFSINELSLSAVISLSVKSILTLSRFACLCVLFNILGNIRIMFLLCLFRIFSIYTHPVFCISIQFSNTVVTLRNESRQILEFLMHFCSSLRYVM